MMQPLARRARIAVSFWVILAVVAWNGLYDLLLARSTETYLFRQAMHLSGQGPVIDLSSAMDLAVRDAIWVATLWANILLLAGLLTFRWGSGLEKPLFSPADPSSGA
jgi:hypothetical protein